MRRLTLLAVSALAVGVLLPGSGLAGVGGTDRPFKESASGTVMVNLVTGQADGVGTGIGSHLGRVAVVDHLQFTSPTDWLSLAWTGTAANGDQISMTGSGTAAPIDATHTRSVGTFTVIGGTGRFANATGEVTATTINTLVSTDGVTATYHWEGTLVGTLSY